MSLDLVRIWTEMGALVRAVVIVLTVQGIACLTVVFDRIFLLFRSYGRSKKFAAEAKPLLERRDHSALVSVASKAQGHLAALMSAGVGVYLRQRAAGERHDKAVELARRTLDRKHELLGADLNRGLSILASTGSTAPFVGLLGTVLGIIHAFQAIAATGSGGLGTIGAAIGEALIVTGYGLVIAIPTVLAYNWLSGRVTTYEMGLSVAAGELIDHLDGQAIAEGHGTIESHGTEPRPHEPQRRIAAPAVS